MQTFRPIGHHAQIIARHHQRIPEGLSLPCIHRDLVAQLARERDPVNAALEAPQRAVRPLHKGQRVFADIHAAQLFQTFACVGADHGDLRILLGDIGDVDVEIPPLGLEPFFHMLVDAFRAARRCMTQEGVVIDPRNDTIVDQEPVFRTHQAIAAFTRFQRAHHIGVQHVEEAPRVRSLDDDLAKGGGIQHPQFAARVGDLAHHRVMGGFALARIGIGASPLADGFPFGPVRFVPVMQRGAADRLEHIATRLARDRAHRNRVVRRAEGGGPNGGNIRIHRARQRCQPVDIAELPLIRRHAKRGIAFGVFDADKAFLRSKPHV